MQRIGHARNAIEGRAVQESLQHETGGADLEVIGEKRQVGVTDNHMKSAETVVVRMRFIAGIYDGTALHGINTLQLREKVGPLGDLKTMLDELIFFFPAIFSRAAIDLAGNEERNDRLTQHVPGEGARHE